jgi:hypothetical protein
MQTTQPAQTTEATAEATDPADPAQPPWTGRQKVNLLIWALCMVAGAATMIFLLQAPLPRPPHWSPLLGPSSAP